MTSLIAIKGDLITAVAASMKITQAASDALREDTLNDEVQRLADLLFLPEDKGTMEDIFMGILQQGRLNSAEAEPKNYPVSSGHIFSRIATHESTQTIFCDLKRFKRKTTWRLKGETISVTDTANGITFDEKSDSPYEGCRSGDVMAFTRAHQPANGQSDSNLKDFIQLCPWFLVASGFPQFKEVDDKSMMSRFNKKYLPSNLPNSTPIDSFDYLKHVIIHEVNSYPFNGVAKTLTRSSFPTRDPPRNSRQGNPHLTMHMSGRNA